MGKHLFSWTCFICLALSFAFVAKAEEAASNNRHGKGISMFRHTSRICRR